jgi:hypothetical protein
MRVYVNTHSILEHYQGNQGILALAYTCAHYYDILALQPGILALAYTCAHYYDILALQPPDYSSKYTEADMQEDKEHFLM